MHSSAFLYIWDCVVCGGNGGGSDGGGGVQDAGGLRDREEDIFA